MGNLVLTGATSGSTTIAPTDAVTATLTLPSSTGTLLSTTSSITSSQLPAGTVLQVVASTITAQVTTTNNTFTSTGHTVTITPKFSTSKIYVVATGDGGTSTGSASAWYTVFRNGSTNLSTGTALGAAISMRASGASDCFGAVAMSFLDSPNTTSSTTYTVYFGNSSGATSYWAPVPGTPSSPSATITVMEIAA